MFKRLVIAVIVAIIGGAIVVFFAPLIMLPENGDFYECWQSNCIHHIRIIDSIGYHYLGWGGQLLWPTEYQVVIERAEFDRPYASYPCQNAIIYTNSSGTFYICPHTSEISNVVFSLPAPVYKKMPCTSTYGCARPYGYQEIVPPDLLSQKQKQVIIDKVMNLPEVKLNSGWALDSFIIQPRADRWTANVQLFLAGIKQLPPSQECGWYGEVEVDLQTLEVLESANIPPTSDVKCNSGMPRIELTLDGLKDRYKVGEIIDVSATQKGGGCGMPEIVILDENRQIVLVSQNDVPISCPALERDDWAEFTLSWSPQNNGSPIIMNQTGSYTLVAEYDDKRVEQKFMVVE